MPLYFFCLLFLSFVFVSLCLSLPRYMDAEPRLAVEIIPYGYMTTLMSIIWLISPV